MQTDKLTLVVIFQDDDYSSCVRYIFDLFSRVHGYACHFVADNQDRMATADVVIKYGEMTPFSDSGSDTPTINVHRCRFFSDEFGKSNKPPENFSLLLTASKATAFMTMAQRTATSATIVHDVIAAAFYLLSGYHDWTTQLRDPAGRVLSSQIALPVETWDMPHVNHWFRQLDELVRSLHRRETETTQPAMTPAGLQTICLTHDVDLLRKYRPGNLGRHLTRTAKANPAQMLSETRRAARVLSGRERDPYDSIDSLYTVKERISAPSTFFFLGSKPGGHNGDYQAGGREARNLMTRARGFGDELAFHGSWESSDSAELTRDEKEKVQQAVQTPIQGARQHYLRFETPDTWKHLASAGIRYDSSGGFPDRCGFKYGWSGCFYPFDLDAMHPLPILEIPLVCMDITLSSYEKIPAELALERLSTLLDSACDGVPGGAFVFLWHNVMGDRVAYPGYFDTFEYFFSVASGSARYITMAQLCDEFESPR